MGDPTSIRLAAQTKRDLDFLVGFFGETRTAVIARLAAAEVQRIIAQDKRPQPQDGAGEGEQ